MLLDAGNHAGTEQKDVACLRVSGQMMGCLCAVIRTAPHDKQHNLAGQQSEGRGEAAADGTRQRVSEGCRMGVQQISANYTLSKLMWIKSICLTYTVGLRMVFAAKDIIPFA